MGVVVGVGCGTGFERRALDHLQMRDNLGFGSGESPNLPITNHPIYPQPCSCVYCLDLVHRAEPQTAARHYRCGATFKGVILIKGDIIALSFDQLMPQTHRHPIGSDQGDFRPLWHPVYYSTQAGLRVSNTNCPPGARTSATARKASRI